MTLRWMTESPHRRFNPLTREWVLVSPHRTQRPWQGQVEKHHSEVSRPYDPACYLCPGNSRAGGVVNPSYPTTFAFDNDFPALFTREQKGALDEEGLLLASTENGRCRVVCFSPRHDLTLATMDVDQIRPVIDTWADEYRSFLDSPDVAYVQIFENRGEMMGASNPHPHCQVWATESIPNEPAREAAAQLAHRVERGTCLLCDVLRLEEKALSRLVVSNEHFVAIVPFWAIWPFETLVLGRRHVGRISDLTAPERVGLADLLKKLTTRYDNLFEVSFPYSMGFHQQPVDPEPHPEWHMHLHFYPPLLRSATIRKFMVGFEMLGGPQRDITPEAAADRLRSLPATHYRQAGS